MRIAQFSDLHYSGKNLAEADRCFSFAVERAIALGVDVAVVSGDSTDHALDVHSPAIERLARNIRRLAEHCPVLMLQGTWSHEPPGTLSIFRLLGGRYGVHVADRIQQVSLDGDGRWQASEGWCFDRVPDGVCALFSCVPTVNKGAVAAARGAAQASAVLGEELAALLRGFAVTNRTAAARAGAATIGVSHGTVFSCISEHGVPMAGFDHEFTTGALFGSGAQAFMLGHIHRHQLWRQDGQCIAYPGSIGRFHYGEQGEKGFLLWEVGDGKVNCELQPTPARRTFDLFFDGTPDLERINAAIQEHRLQGASVRVRWTVADEARHEVDRTAIKRALEGAAEVQLEGRIVPIVRSRAEGISRCASLSAKVRAWAEVAGARAEPLLACLERLSHQEPEQIAGEVLARGAALAPDAGGCEQPVGALPAGGDAVLRPVKNGRRVELELF